MVISIHEHPVFRYNRAINMTRLILLFLSFCLLTTLSVQAQVSNPTGGARQPLASDIMPKTLEGSNFNEFWNYHFYMDNGMKVHITFSVVDFGSFKSPVGGIRISIYNLKGETYQVAREYPIDRLFLDTDSKRFQLHPERDFYFEGNLPEKHKVRIFNRKDGVLYDIELVFDDIQPGRVFGDGLFTIGDNEVGIITHIPYAKVSGHVAVDDVRSEVTGTAYMDHTWQFQSSVRLIHSGYRFVRHTSSTDWDLLYFLLPDYRGSMQTIGYRLKRTADNVTLSGIERITIFDNGRVQGRQVADRLRLQLRGGGELDLVREENEEVYSALSELGWLARRAVRTFLGGELVDLRGRGYVRENGRNFRGEYSFVVVN